MRKMWCNFVSTPAPMGPIYYIQAYMYIYIIYNIYIQYKYIIYYIYILGIVLGLFTGHVRPFRTCGGSWALLPGI